MAYFNKTNNSFDSIEHNRHERKVYCETTGLHFDSTKEALEYYNILCDSIWWSCKHAAITSYGFKWRYTDDKYNELRQAI